ncbi:hypothetical protein FB451DRAFT_1280290, partial [Mycena latifolia]
MLAPIFPVTVALGLASLITADTADTPSGSSIPGLTDGQQTCLANCIFFGIPAAANCDPNADPPDVACFCGSSAYTSNVTQCASATCSICTTGGCNITADPLTDQCNSATLSGSSASSSKTAAAPGGSNSPGAVTTSTPGAATSSGSTIPSPSATPTSASAAFNCVNGAVAFKASRLVSHSLASLC